MGERFATPGEVREHWFGGGDTYRITETKSEAEERRAVARSRAHRSRDEELVGEALVIASVQRTTLPVPDQYRWGVFHAGTALPVLMTEATAGAAQARALAEALDAWRDPESGEAFEWGSDGLSDRLRSPYGRGMLDQVRGVEPGERWAAEPPPAETDAYETDDGQTYTYAQVDRELRVFAPGGLLVAHGTSRFDANTKKEAWIGESRDGRRLAGRWERHFVEHAVQQHLIAQREPADRDPLWIHYSSGRAMVHGSDRYDQDLKKLMRSAGFTWSGNAKAYVTASTTRPVARAQSVDRLARALYEEGRAVEIRADEDRLRGIFAPAITPNPGAVGVAAAAAGGVAAAAAAPVPAPEPAPVVEPRDLTDDLLAAERARLTRERDAAVWGGTKRRRLDEQLAPLNEEHSRRIVASYQGRADPDGMSEEELTAEREQLAQILRTPAYGRDPVNAAQQERADLLEAEYGRRLAAELEARLPVLQMGDDDLHAEGETLAKGRYGAYPGPSREAFEARRGAVGVEIADRSLRTWEPRQTPAGELDDIELTEAIEALRSERLYDAAFAGHFPSKQRVEKAHGARLEVLRVEQKKRDTVAYEALLKADGRIRTEPRSYNAAPDDPDVTVFIDGRRYAHLTAGYPSWTASIDLGRGLKENTAWRTEALTWIIAQYESSPHTRDTRTWGPVADVELPPSLVEHLITRNSKYTGANESEKYLLDRMVNSPRTQSWDENSNKIMVHILDLPERTLPVLEQMGRRLVAELDNELDSEDRKTKERAKRARPNVLRGLDDIRETMTTRGLVPLTDVAAAPAPQDGEADGERVRADGPTSLDDVPAPGTGADAGPGGVLRGVGGRGAGEDRGADAAADGRSDAGDGSRAAGREAEGRAADGEGTGPSGDRAGGAGGGEPGRGAAPVAVRFRPTSQEDLAPAGERAKAHANLAAVRTLKQVQAAERPATAEEQQILARWSGWGSVPDVFAARPQQDDPAYGPGGEREGGYAAAAARWEALSDVRDPLRELLDGAEWRAAAASTLSAHYTPPEVTAALWQALADLGFDGGEVLEPGSGAGVTFGTAPDSARMTGVEIDPTSAAISRLLAPGVTVLNESFADTIAPDGSFDVTVGNVPFARLTLFDPKHNKARHRIHNHFLVKSAALTRPGGVVALITSRHTLDAERDAARRELFESADLLGAVRLPNKAFARSAGTDVVTDILILRRRTAEEMPGDAGWVTSTRRDLDGNTLPVSDYFTAHPEHVLGNLTSRMGAHGPEVAVDGDPEVGVALNTALRQITDKAVLDHRGYQPHPDGPHRPLLRLRPAAQVTDFTGRLSADADGQLWQANSNGDPIAIELPETEHAQLTALIALKDLVRGLNDLDRRATDTGLADAQRRQTKVAYQRYVGEYGALSRPRQQQNATVKADDGAEQKRLTGYGYFLNDPSAYEVLALEWWEADTETVHVSQLLDRAPATRRSVLGQHTDDPQQALTAVVAERGTVDLDHIAWMLQVEPAEARRLLARNVFTDPITGDLVHSPDYLSGDIRTKLAIAKQAARRDRTYETNVAELERVLPRELLPGQFAIRLGAAWIPDDMVQDFFRGYLGDAHLTIQHSGGGNWHILKGRNLAEEDELRHSAGGLGPLAMVSKVLNGGAMAGRPSDDEEAARAVRVKADAFRDAFEAWALDDSLRAARIAEVYNTRMNARAVRDFTGSAPSLAGLDPDFTPYDHQLAAAARMAHERCLVLAHEVGAGKTATMTIGMMAMRNTGQVDKPLVTVPNYLVEEWESTVRRLFPTARILALTSADLEDGKRDRMLEYIRANDFDLIITSHSLFDSIPLSPEFHEVYNNTEARLLREQIIHERKREGKSVSLKALEERAAQFEEELKARAGAVRTPGQVYLDDLGIDFFAVDEFHEYKNLAVRSKIPGARVKGSAKAQHLHGVLEWARMNKPTGPIGVVATGTVLSNAIGEIHGVGRMANPDLLRDIDAETFDAWASMYGKTVERMEMTTDGKGFKSVERFASFHNVPGLVRQLWHPLVDFKSAEELGLELPRLKGGEPELMLVPATADQLQRMQELGERYAAFHEGGVDKSVDNPLAINNDARVIAMDGRLIDADAEPGNKLVALADRIIATYEETKDNRYNYSATDDRPHPVPGALIGVFLNNGTPGGKNRGGFNAYQELKDLLIARGMPAEKVAFVHDAERADQRLKMAHQANHGGINVVIGSTMRMGKGVNWQNRMTSLFHVDPDWRPSDMAQRDGRIVRNGNQNKEVEIVWMATEGTFDSRMYGLLATKAKGFNQLYKARLDDMNDEMMEVEDASLPYEEAMAIISGNPYLIQQEDLRKELRTLDLDQRNRATQRAILGKRLNELRIDIENLSYDIPRRARALPLLEPVLGDDFHITLAGTQYTKHKDAAGPLMDLLTGVGQSLPADRDRTRDAKIGHLGGLDLIAVAYREDDGTVFVRLHLDVLPGIVQRSTLAELADLKGETVLGRLVKSITSAPERQTESEGNLATKRITRDKLLIERERLRGQVPGLGRVRERKSLVDNLVAAQATLNKISKPKKDEAASVTTSRHEATARRDDLQQRLDNLTAELAPEASTEAGSVLRDMDDVGPRLDPANYTPVQREAEAALLRAHLIVHGHNPEVAARLAALGGTTDLLLPEPAPELAPTPAPTPASGPQPTPERPQTPLEGLMAGFGDRVVLGHVGGPPKIEEAGSSGGGAPADEQAEQQLPDPESPAPEPAPAPAPDNSGTAEGDPEPDADPYGTADLFDTFGLPLPERGPAPDAPAPEESQEEAEGIPEGQMTLEEAGPQRGDDGRDRLTSTDGRLTFTLLNVPADAGVLPETVEAYHRRREEFAAVVAARNAQSAQSSEERDRELARWQRGYKAANGLELWKPVPALRLTRRTDAPGLTPAEYALGSWVTWQDTTSGTPVTGQVMSPGAAANTWFVSTGRTAVTGEYHVLARDGKKATGYSYSINGATTDLRPAAGPPAPAPFESLPAVDSIPARPVPSYADYVPKRGMAMVREPVTVLVGPDEVRGDEVVFPVTVDGIPFVVTAHPHEASGTLIHVLGVEVDGQLVARTVWSVESRASVVEAAVRIARTNRELADKPLYARGSNHRLDVAEDGVCARCNRQFDGDSGEQELYRVDGGEPTCAPHIASSLDVAVREVEELGLARRIRAARTAPEPQPDTAAAPAEEPPAPDPAPAPEEPRLVDRATVGPGDLVTIPLGVPGGGRLDREVSGAARISGILYPAYRDYRPRAVLLDSVIHDADGNELATGADTSVHALPAQVHLTPAGHRADLRPETRTAGQIRLGDLIADGGTRGEVVTEVHYASDPRGSSGFSSRDIAKGTVNGFSLRNREEVLVVPRERRRPQDVAEVFGRHQWPSEVAVQTRWTVASHADLDREANRLWPDGDGPQDELRALREAVAAIDTDASGRKAYRANAAAMTTAAAAAATLFDAVDDTIRYRGLGKPLHRLRQHLDVQIHRLHADVTYLTERAAAAPANPSTADEPTPPAPEKQRTQDQTAERTPGGEDMASRGASETEQLGLFGDPAQDPAEGPAEPTTATSSGAVPAETAAPLGLAGTGVEGNNAAPEPAEEAPVVVDVNTLAVSPRVRDGEPSSYEFTVTGPGLTVGEYEISHDAQGRGARGIMWQAWWHGVEPSGRWDVINIGFGKGRSAVLAAVTAHAAKADGDLAAGFTVARRMEYDAGLWLLPEVEESEAIQYHPDGSWTITAATGAPYTVRREWRGRTASGGLSPLLIEDQAGTLVASCTAVDSYMSAWEPMLDRLRLHATAVADEVQHATAVTLGGPGRDWVEAWCVCSWTERTDVATYADRTPAGEALAQAHHSETSTADAAPQPLAAVVAPTPDDATQTETAQAPPAAELPELDVVLLDVGVPPLDPAEPYSTDEEAQADIDRLGEAFARWDALPTVQRYYDTDRQQRPDGSGGPTNPVAQLSAAYQGAEQSLRNGPAGSPDDLVRQVRTVAVWSGALEAAAGEELAAPLGELSAAAHGLAARSQATIEAFAAEQTSPQPPPDLSAVAPDPTPAPAPTKAPDTEPAAEQSMDEVAPAAAVPAAPEGEEQTPLELPASEPLPEEVPAAQEGAVGDGAEFEDPPEPQRFSTSIPLDYEEHVLVLEGEDGGGYDRGELRREGQSIATVHRTFSGQWYARMQLDPPDITRAVDAPQTAAEQAAVMFSVFTSTPLGPPVVAAQGDDVQARLDQVRGELREFAAVHARSIETAARLISPGYAQSPLYVELAARLADVANSQGSGVRMMAADLGGVERAVNEWGAALPSSASSEIRSAMVFPLAHVLFDVRQLQTRLQATVETARQEPTSAAAAQQSVPAPDPEHAATPTSNQPPAPSLDLPEDPQMATPAPPTTPEGADTAPQTPQASPVAVTTIDEPLGAEPAEVREIDVEDPPAPRPFTEVYPLPDDPSYELHLSGLDGQAADTGELRRDGMAVAHLGLTAEGWWVARQSSDGMAADETSPAATPQEAAARGAVMYAVLAGAPYGAPPTAVDSTDPSTAADMMRQELSAAAKLHRGRIADAAGSLTPDYRQMPYFQAVDGWLARLGEAVGDQHGAVQMNAHLAAVERAANGWGSSLSDTSGDVERRTMAYPLAQLLHDTRWLQGRLQTTVDALRAAGATPQTADAAQAPQKPPVVEEKVAAQAEPSVPAIAPEGPTTGTPTPGPAHEGADTGAAVLPEPPTNPSAPVEQAAGTAEASDRPAESNRERGTEEPSEGPGEAAPADEQADAVVATQVAPGTELPLTVSAAGAADTPAPDPSVDLLAKFREVRRAVDAIVARGEGAALDADVRNDLITLQTLLGETVDDAPPVTSAGPEPADTTSATSEPAGDNPSEQPDPQQAAAAVNTALRHADEHAVSLQDLPEWQGIQTIRGAFGHLMSRLKIRAGEHFDRLMGDERVGSFVRDLSARVCDKIATLAVAGADWLRRDHEGGRNTNQPSAEALLRLGDAAHAFSTPQADKRKPGVIVDVPAMRKMGEALARPMPSARKVSASAARSRSKTGQRPTKKSPSAGTDQTAHLRRGGPDQPQSKKPQR
ncbi:SNF2-related protein [Streptomyces sp. Isolate_45]|uniref:SNF2-related protein n=1 Tax=Streptomyces sp. Isolate_45 TaxID=2950111 RepID=UPI002481E2D5|nr:SNF2-related protein [Streptomyces sp. Isolate_45]MDA5279944.1 hypothetical protein [Streptomyces sp. Isolate_45]